MKRKGIVAIILVMLVSGALWAGGKAEQTLPFEQRFRSMSWEQIVEEARDQRLYWYMWGGSDLINKFVNGYVAERLNREYGIVLEMVPVTDATTFVNKVLGEKQAGRNSGGSVDVMWINGENFRTMREADLLFGPYSDRLPNMQYVDGTDSSIANDFGFPVEGYESPYGSAQVVMAYDSARVPQPPRQIGDLLEWIRANPGKFTYPAIPDFTGSVFVRHLFYHVAGGYEQLLGPFDQQLFDQIAPKVWRLLNDLEPYLWREGNTYPETHTKLQDLFANGEVYFDISYNPSEAASLVSQGRYPDSVRTFVFDSGTIGNTHYVAISYNSSSKAAAMVLANLLLDPATQYEKSRPEVWGDLTVLDVGDLPEDWRDKFASLPRPSSVLPAEMLSSHRIPELQATWLEAIEKGWTENVLQK
ncbi:MAG: ABC transporter substrate-binding protein [Spirochaetaceae bacterium]|nr:MAG: ABC transporter substrate-binding protein [Spirochaetaceae bacterium]